MSKTKKTQDARTSISTREPLESQGSSETSSKQRPTNGDSLESGVHHLVTVPCAAALVEVSHVVAAGERSIGDLLFKELAERGPAVVDVVFEQTLRGNQAADLGDMILVDLLALAGKIASEEGLEELVQHGVVHARGPAEVRDELVLWV
jgi:hypothetical protein